MPVYSSPNLTQTANGQDMYLRTEPPSGTDLIVGNLQVTGQITGNGPILSTTPGATNTIQLSPNAGGFASLVYQNGALQTLVGLQSATGPLLVGNNNVPVGMTGTLSVAGNGLSAPNPGSGITAPQGLVSYRIDNIVSPNTDPSSIILTPAQCPFLNDNSISYMLCSLTPNGPGGVNSAQFNKSYLNFTLVGQRKESPGGINWVEFDIIPLPGTLGQPALILTTTGTGLSERYGIQLAGVTQGTSYTFSVTIFNRVLLVPPSVTP